MTRGRLPALGALLAMAAIVIGVPVLLVALVGNPWPGWTQLELRDDAAVLVGVLACLAWLVWLRFVIAVVVEVRAQLAELREIGSTVAPALMPVSAAPPRRGTGIVAQRLVAAALVLLPMATRVSHAVADDGLGGGDARGAATAPASPAAPAAPAPTPAAPAATATRAVTVVPGDTLFGLARSQLGDSARWREIYDLNRERPQRDGGRLTSPSMIRAGWRLLVPADVAPASAPASGGLDRPAAAPAPDVAAAAFTVSSGDTLWALARDRLRGAGLPDDDVAVADYVHAIVENNHDIIEDPNLIFAGDRLDLPAIGRAAAPEPPPVPAPPSPPLAVAMEPPVPMAAPAPDSAEPAAPPATIAEVATPVAPTPTTTSAPPAAPVGGGPVGATSTVPGSPAPIGIGEAALLSAGVLALVASRRRTRLRASRPRARVPEPPGGSVVTERRLRAVDASERLLRVDVAIRAAAASLVEGTAQVAVVCAGVDGGIDLTLTAVATLPGPWEGEGLTWSLPGSTPIELLVDAARTVGAPCVALAQLGVASDGRDVLADLEALGVLAIDAPEDLADSVVRGLAATLASSVFAEVANLVGAGIDEGAFLEHRHAHRATTVDGALELAATLVGTTSAARQSTFALRARHTSGEAWEPAVVLVGSSLLGEATADLVSSAARRRGGLALVVGGPLAEAPWSLRATDRRWVLDPVGIELVPVGLSVGELGALHHVLEAADAPLLDDEPVVADLEAAPGVDDLAEDEPWSLMVRLLGQVEVVDAGGASAGFERSKALELIAWLTLHRDRATRAGARTALWELDVRDATFANVVSEARRAMARLVDPPPGEEWLGRTLTEVLPLHAGVVADVDIVRRRLTAARLQPPELAIETLRPAVELIHDMPFAGTGYLWPDAEGITSNLVLLATSASTELAGHFLSMGDIDGVFWATGQGLRVLPGHEELIALRMRAHARAGDLSGVRLEWESYERVLDADPWSDGEPAPKLVLLRRELLSS